MTAIYRSPPEGPPVITIPAWIEHVITWADTDWWWLR